MRQVPRRQGRAFPVRARAGASAGLRHVPRTSRVGESADADSPRSPVRLYGMPFQPAGAATGGGLDSRNGGPGDSRSAQSAIPKLYPLPSKGAWLLCEPDFTQMRLLPAFLFTVAAFAQATPQAGQDAKGAIAPA